MASDLDRLTVVKLGMPGPSGAGITASEKTTIDSRLTALEGTVGVVVQDEGGALATRGTTINFTGAGVTASGAGATKTVTIPGGALVVQENDVTVDAAATTLDFNGTDFDVTSSPAGEANVSRAKYPTIFASSTKSSAFPSLSTALQDIHTVEIGPLANGVVYDIECEVHARLSPDSTGYARVYARIAGDASVLGEQTGSVGGERSCHATTTKLNVTGDGVTTYTLRARADMDTSTGTVSSCHIRGRAIPR